MSITKITSANVRISLSFNYNTFEVSLGLENLDGISPDEIEEFRLTAQDMANEAVTDYKLSIQFDTKVAPFIKKDNANATDVENLPLYTDIKKAKQPVNHKEFERMEYLINDCLTIKELMKLKKDVPAELNDIFNNKFIQLGDGK